MPNRGLFAGHLEQAELWTPLLQVNTDTGNTSSVQLGAGSVAIGRLWRLPRRLIIAQFEIAFGAGASPGAGSMYKIRLPEPLLRPSGPGVLVPIGDGPVGNGCLSRLFAGRSRPCSFILGDGDNDQTIFIDAGLQMETGLATVPNAATVIANVAHNLGGTPDVVMTNLSNSNVFSAAVTSFADTLTAATMSIHAMGASGMNLTAAQGVNWLAMRQGVSLCNPTTPWAWAANDQIKGTVIGETP